mmetsp:Transcript_9130/g.20886  ORF Transcript_9130/g.20886 Transcript_9130/m.20886 type:complete len:232 (-) Transcript_9130:21-716(-)
MTIPRIILLIGDARALEFTGGHVEVLGRVLACQRLHHPLLRVAVGPLEVVEGAEVEDYRVGHALNRCASDQSFEGGGGLVELLRVQARYSEVGGGGDARRVRYQRCLEVRGRGCVLSFCESDEASVHVSLQPLRTCGVVGLAVWHALLCCLDAAEHEVEAEEGPAEGRVGRREGDEAPEEGGGRRMRPLLHVPVHQRREDVPLDRLQRPQTPFPALLLPPSARPLRGQRQR